MESQYHAGFDPPDAIFPQDARKISLISYIGVVQKSRVLAEATKQMRGRSGRYGPAAGDETRAWNMWKDRVMKK
jgi:hypothetical protein